MKVTAIMATCGRHFCSERSLSLFLEQDYNDRHLLIFQNSNIYQRMDDRIDPSLVTLINSHIDTQTLQPYTSLGAIYNDAIKYLPGNTDVITFWDDDDLFFDDHLTQGVNGLLRGGKTAYKPAASYFRTATTMSKEQNVFEPSIFIKAEHILRHGFYNTTTNQHFKWLEPLIVNNDIFVDKNGKSTLIYNWTDEAGIYKTSARSHDPNHFSEYRFHSFDHGDKVISPISVFGDI